MQINDWEGWIEYKNNKIFKIMDIKNVKIISDKIVSLTILNIIPERDFREKVKDLSEEETYLSLEKCVIKIKQGEKEFNYINTDGDSICIRGYPYKTIKDINIELKE